MKPARIWICLERLRPDPCWAVRVGNRWLIAKRVEIATPGPMAARLATKLRPCGPQPQAYLEGYGTAVQRGQTIVVSLRAW